MRINYNSTAMHANNSLNVTDNKVSRAIQRLSSGLKINSAKDNPSGYAIGRRMNAQIEGVSVATRNANTGISIIETADGALTEIHDMLQRMNELAIKGATGTLTTSDRMILNQELQQLKKEVTRIAKDTEFNGQTLLDGSFELKGYTNDLSIKVGYYSDEVLAKEYTIDSLSVFFLEDGKIDFDKTKASFVAGAGFPDGVELTSVGENCVTFTNTEGFELTLDIDEYYAAQRMKDNIETQGSFNFVSAGTSLYGQRYVIDKLSLAYDENGDLDADSVSIELGNNFPADAKAEVNGNVISITSDTDPNFSLEFSIPATYDPNTEEEYAITIEIPEDGITDPIVLPFGSWDPNAGSVTYTDLQINITGIGSMDTQIGANEGQVLAIRIPTISLQRLGLTHAELITQEKSSDAIVAIKGAIQYVSDIRSRLGAYQNRLEHTVSSLDITNENMTAAYSRIMDADMAEEMTDYTTQQVVAQAAVSMLAQANERPSQVLQLLQ